MSEPKFIEVKDRPKSAKAKADKKHNRAFTFPKNGVEGIWTWKPDGELVGTIIFVHGMFDNVNTTWAGDFAHYSKSMHSPGPSLHTQFEASGVKAFFIVPEAEIISG